MYKREMKSARNYIKGWKNGVNTLRGQPRKPLEEIQRESLLQLKISMAPELSDTIP